MPTLQGQLLIASPQMRDPNFHRTVILILRDEDDGAMGLVLNRPLEMTLKETCEKALDTPCGIDGFLHQGGPCDGPMMVLHAGHAFGEVAGDQQILPGVWFITNKAEIESLLADCDGPFKCFIGYAGWGEGQLAKEIESGAWLAHAADVEALFSDDQRQWSKLMLQVTLGSSIDPRRIPDDPSVN